MGVFGFESSTKVQSVLGNSWDVCCVQRSLAERNSWQKLGHETQSGVGAKPVFMELQSEIKPSEALEASASFSCS